LVIFQLLANGTLGKKKNTMKKNTMTSKKKTPKNDICIGTIVETSDGITIEFFDGSELEIWGDGIGWKYWSKEEVEDAEK